MSRKGDGGKVSRSAWVIALGSLGSWRLCTISEVSWWQLYESLRTCFLGKWTGRDSRLGTGGLVKDQGNRWMGNGYTKRHDAWDFSGCPVVKTGLPLQGVGVWSLVEQLISCMSCRVAKKKVTMSLVPVPCLLLKHPMGKKGQIHLWKKQNGLQEKVSKHWKLRILQKQWVCNVLPLHSRPPVKTSTDTHTQNVWATMPHSKIQMTKD